MHFDDTFKNPHLKSLFAFTLGSLNVFSFAPYYFYPISFITLILFFSFNKEHSKKLSFFYGLGFFIFGIHWIYIALNTYGNMHPIGASISTLGLCIFLALFYIPLGFKNSSFFSLFLVASFFTLAEWLRSFIFTGFPWLSLGYSQVPNGAFVGYLPILGIHGVTFFIVLTALMIHHLISTSKKNIKLILILFILIIFMFGKFAHNKKWTEPMGNPFSISLIQGNVDQSLKWDQKYFSQTLSNYSNLINDAQGDLVVLPETTIPVTFKRLPETFKKRLINNRQKFILGAIRHEDNSYLNSGVFISNEYTQFYDKRHLVPFGEFIPLRFIFNVVYEKWLNIPFNDLKRGDKHQQLFEALGNKIALNICYEDVFGDEIIEVLPDATVLINISNDAWYGRSNAASQHLQISQARAIETGRMMLRATNTGATAIISNHGKIIDSLPHFQRGILEGNAQGFEGSTPYSKHGSKFSILICIIILMYELLVNRRFGFNREQKNSKMHD